MKEGIKKYFRQNRVRQKYDSFMEEVFQKRFQGGGEYLF